MNPRIKEYQAWYHENKDFYENLKSHGSILYTRFYPVYDVLYQLYVDYKDQDTLDEDLDKIIQVGLEFIHQQFYTCKTYLENIFNNDFHLFLEYDQIINYLLFLEDLKYELAEKEIIYHQDKFDDLIEELEAYISDRKAVPNNINVYVDSRLTKIIPTDLSAFQSIIDIFVEIGNTLGIDFDEEEDIIIGKDI
ncbi:MAG TPA: hypothetical protein VJ878_04920 [Candidatus Izemoplasmatales bacterium]|nr:hypothetical protein [Candidatus Izemoplasmatales bacterium]